MFNKDAGPREEAAILYPKQDATTGNVGKTPQRGSRRVSNSPDADPSKRRPRAGSSPIPWSDSEEETTGEPIPKTPQKTPRTTGFASPGQGGPATAMRNMAMNTPTTAESSRRAYKFQEAMNTPPVPRPNFGQAPPAPKTPTAHRSNLNSNIMTTPSSTTQSAMPQTPATPGGGQPIDLVTDVFAILAGAGVSLDDKVQIQLQDLLSKSVRKTQGYIRAYVLCGNVYL